MKALIISLLIILSMSAAKSGTAAESIPELNPFGPFNIPDNEAMLMMDQMGVGWNLGNTFDAFQDPYRGDEMRLESYWNGCMTTDAMFEALSNAGFRSVRIPVSWHNHVTGPDHGQWYLHCGRKLCIVSKRSPVKEITEPPKDMNDGCCGCKKIRKSAERTFSHAGGKSQGDDRSQNSSV